MLLFDLKKTSKEESFDAIIEKLPDSDIYYIKHRDGTNAFCVKKDKKQVKKDEIIKLIKVIDSKINKSTNKSRIPQPKQMRRVVKYVQ